MTSAAYALSPDALVRSFAASRDTLGKVPMKLLDVVAEVRTLTRDSPYAVIGGLAQILWARKTHTDDLDVALAAEDLSAAHDLVRRGAAGPRWTLPEPPDRAYETDDVFQVVHLSFSGSVVDLIAFRDSLFNMEIVSTANPVPELGGIRFVRPELLLVCHLLRPGPQAALAAVELILARRAKGGMDLAEPRTWADRLGRGERFERAVAHADSFALE